MSEAVTSADPLDYQVSEVTFAPTPVVITQLTGKKRRLSLAGRALPFRGLGLGVTQRHNKHTPNGATEGSLQVLGPEYDDTSMGGRWQQSYFESGAASVTIDGLPIRNIRQMERVLHDMTKEGQLVEVTWDTQSRRGLIAHFDPRWDRGEVCHWTLEFVWIGTGTVAKMPVTVTLNPAQSVSWLDSLFSDIDAFLDQIDDVEQTMLNGLRKAAAFKDQMFDALDRAARLVITPIQLTANLIQLATSVVTELRDFLTGLPRRIADAFQKVVTACLGFPDAFSGWGIQGAGGARAGASAAIDTGAGTQGDRDEQSYSGHPPTVTPGAGKTPITFLPVTMTVPPLPFFQNVQDPVAAETVSTDPTAAESVPAPVQPPAGPQVPGPSAPPGAGNEPGSSWSEAPQPAEPQTQGMGSPRSASGLGTVVRVETLQRRFLVLVRRLLLETVAFRTRLEQYSQKAYDLQTIWICGQSDDLRRIAERVYGDFRGWRDILHYNRLDTAACTPGQVVFVPRRRV